MTADSMGPCPRCGTRLLAGALACVNCDLPLTPSPPPAAAAETTEAAATPPPAPYAPPPPYPGAPPPYVTGPPPPYVAGPPGPYGPPTWGPPPSYYPGAGWGPPPQSTNGMAIASLVMSLLWFAGLSSVLAVIFGHVSRRQLKQRPEKGGGLALAGLIVGYVGVVGGIAFWILIAVVFTNTGVRNTLVRDDLHNAAAAEQSYLVDNGTYTNDRDDLRSEGFTYFPTDTVDAAYNGSVGYCVIGSRNGESDWYLYDSHNDGLSTFVYPTAQQAESACTVPDLSPYASIS